MAYKLEFEQKEGYLYILMEGPESYSNAMKFWEDLSEKARDENHNKFLIVDKVSGSLSTTEIFYLSEKIAKLFLGKIIAYVDPKQETIEHNKFGETVVYKRGVVAKVFNSEPEAVEWITSI